MARQAAMPALALLAALAGEVLGRALGAALVLGVAPEDQARYAGREFRCFDGKGPVLPVSAINDEFCDCADGSDEPGTGACAGQTTTVFYCRNDGSTPRHLYASRVGDGICDCCDGSDETSSGSRTKHRCPNTCAEQGRFEQEANRRRIEELTRAMHVKEENRQKALVERESIGVEINKLEDELPALEDSVKAIKVEADKEREAKRQKEEAEKATEEADTKKWENEACRWRQTGGCDPKGDREPNNDKKCSEKIVKGSSGFCDCDGNENLDEGEPGFKCVDNGPGTCAAACVRAGKAKEAADAAAATGGEEKPQVSEYAKWMEGAADKMADEKTPEGDEKPQVSEYTKWMENAESKMQEADAKAPPATETTTTTTTTVAPGKTAIDEEREAQRKLDDAKSRINDIKGKLDAMSDDSHLGYASLVGKTLSKKVAEFFYKIKFFGDAMQDSTSLGKWEGWTGPRSGTFTKGKECWGGPARKLNVNFQCGIEEAVLDAFEPSRCVYEATVTHPGACEQADLDALTAGTRIIAAHEEL